MSRPSWDRRGGTLPACRRRRSRRRSRGTRSRPAWRAPRCARSPTSWASRSRARASWSIARLSGRSMSLMRCCGCEAHELFPQIKFKTLARCRAPRVAVAHGSHSLRTAKRNGLRLRVACSHRCKVTITLARPVAPAIGRGAATLKQGKGRVRVWFSRGPGGARQLIVRATASAASHQGRARETARIQGSRLRFDDALSVLMHRRSSHPGTDLAGRQTA